MRYYCLFVILFILSSNSWSQKDYVKHYDTILYSKYHNPIKLNSDSSNYRVLNTYNNYPIQIQQNLPENYIIELDTIPFYYYTGKPLEKAPYNCVFVNPGSKLDKEGEIYVPHSAIYYQNPSSIEPIINSNYLSGTSISSVDFSKFYKPFYISKTEVTNADYRQFVNYVRDSIARVILGEEFPEQFMTPTFDVEGNEKDFEDWNLNWSTRLAYWDEEYIPFLAEMYLPESERYYQRKAFDTRKLHYDYYDDDSIHHILNVYPDTLCWIHNFTYSTFELYTNMYFWHPAFDNYPVVGISWTQAKAFCNWMTRMLQNHYAKEEIDVRVKVDVPSVIQWEAVKHKIDASTNIHEEIAEQIPHVNWLTDLNLKNNLIKIVDTSALFKYENERAKHKTSIDVVYSDRLDGSTEPPTYYSDEELFTKKRSNYIQPHQYNSSLLLEYPLRKNIYHTFPYYSKKEVKKTHKPKNSLDSVYEYKIDFFQKHTDNLGISYMGSNVSEWLLESYEENWKYVFFKRKELLIKSRGADADIQALTEEYFQEYNDEDGKLIMGANWFDQRDGFNFGKNMQGMLPKVFKSPGKSYSTVGFRYVITIEE